MQYTKIFEKSKYPQPYERSVFRAKDDHNYTRHENLSNSNLLDELDDEIANLEDGDYQVTITITKINNHEQ